MTTMKHLPERVLHPHVPRKMAVTHTLASGLHDPFLEVGLPKAKKAGVLAATERINVTAAVAQAKQEMAAAMGNSDDSGGGGGDVRPVVGGDVQPMVDAAGATTAGGDAQPRTTVTPTITANTTAAVATGATTKAVDPAGAAVDGILADPSSRIVLDGVATTTMDNAVLPTTTNDAQDAQDAAAAAAVVQQLKQELKQDGGDPAAASLIGVAGMGGVDGGKVPEMTDQEIDKLLQEVLPQGGGAGGDAGAAVVNTAAAGGAAGAAAAGVAAGAAAAAGVAAGGGSGVGCLPPCGRHGVCIENRCVCSALQAGSDCGAGVSLSWPLLPDAQAPAVGSYEGHFILSKADDISGPLVVCVVLWCCDVVV